MGFFEDGQVPQPGRGGPFGALAQPQVLGQPDQHGAHQERLVPVIAGVLDLEHHVAVQQRREVQRVTALEEPAGGAQPQAGDPDRDEAADVVGDLPAVADLVDDLQRGGLQVLQRGVAGDQAGAGGLTGHQVPAGVLITPGQRGRQDLGERLVGLEGGQEQRPDQVGVGLQREPGAIGAGRGLERVDPGRRVGEVPGADADHFGAGQPGGHQPVFGLGGLDHQPRDTRLGGRLQQAPDRLGLPRPGRAADERVPVQRGPGNSQFSGGYPVPVQHGPDRHRRRRGRPTRQRPSFPG